MADFLNETVRKARKPHKCNLCGNKIEVGRKYHRLRGKYEGEFFDDCLHITCNNIINDFCSDSGFDGYTTDWITDWLKEFYCYNCEHNPVCGKDIYRCETILSNYREE